MSDKFISRMWKVSIVSALALGVGLFGPTWTSHVDLGGAAWAASDNGQGGGKGEGGAGQGSEGKGGSGGQQGSPGGSGQAGPGEDSDGQGPRAGNSGATSGGKPVWAQEGIPEVELGRLSVARSPDAVLDRAYAEAIASLTPEMAEFYSMTLEDIIDALRDDFDAQTYIDSPLQNLALLQDALDGTIELAGVTNDTDTLMAVFLGVASDKTLQITTDTVIAVTTILGDPITGDAAKDLAEDAEAVRDAISDGHG